MNMVTPTLAVFQTGKIVSFHSGREFDHFHFLFRDQFHSALLAVVTNFAEKLKFSTYIPLNFIKKSAYMCGAAISNSQTFGKRSL